ncbi:helix-turn-helix domain-containing protein [Altererythrobacter sp. MTPC7]|uniref:helix-turn-helix transcriptional regulator n=1 Tax=Altererythrobacter sp. MTPC7 TaxID=3056567 RepID=UPI0036F25BA0
MPSYSPQLMLFGRGAVSSDFPSGTQGPVEGGFFVAQLDQATPFHVHGPAEMVGVSLNVKGWAALTGQPVNLTTNRMLPLAGTIADGDAAAAAADIAGRLGRGDIDRPQAASQIASVLGGALRALDPGHEQFIDRMLEWLGNSFNPAIEDLQETLSMSPRTVQRLANRYFGRPPIALAKRYRAVRAATMLSMPDLPDAIVTEIYDSFYDQAHLIRDLRRYTGRTPKRLGGDTETLGEKTLDVRGYGNAALFDRIAEEEAKAKA